MNASSLKKPAIVRIWRGRTPRERADEYEAYNYEAGIKPLIKKALGVQTFREDRDNETEFMTISYWASVEAMSKFTGGDPRKVHHLERDKEFLIELPKEVQILRLLTSHGMPDPLRKSCRRGSIQSSGGSKKAFKSEYLRCIFHQDEKP